MEVAGGAVLGVLAMAATPGLGVGGDGLGAVVRVVVWLGMTLAAPVVAVVLLLGGMVHLARRRPPVLRVDRDRVVWHDGGGSGASTIVRSAVTTVRWAPVRTGLRFDGPSGRRLPTLPLLAFDWREVQAALRRQGWPLGTVAATPPATTPGRASGPAEVLHGSTLDYYVPRWMAVVFGLGFAVAIVVIEVRAVQESAARGNPGAGDWALAIGLAGLAVGLLPAAWGLYGLCRAPGRPELRVSADLVEWRDLAGREHRVVRADTTVVEWTIVFRYNPVLVFRGDIGEWLGSIAGSQFPRPERIGEALRRHGWPLREPG